MFFNKQLGENTLICTIIKNTEQGTFDVRMKIKTKHTLKLCLTVRRWNGLIGRFLWVITGAHALRIKV